ncbi:MAG: N-acetylglucosamine-6-phosphate deacetylase [Oscillospiraceae bacterium]|nr:N-acetylglucosamine-6-phosphate deacetylase [Oscillospiraceae bacterium]
MIIQSKRVWLFGGFYPAQILLCGDKISRVLPYGEISPCEDWGDNRVVPGFIDTHTHGAYGVDATSSPPERLCVWAKKAAGEGITSFLPTTVTQSDEALTAAAKNIAQAMRLGGEGAQILGAHFEGPYLSEAFKGAQSGKHIVKPDIHQFERWQEAAGGAIMLVTVAPEEDEDFGFIRYCASKGIAVSMGHTAASFDQAVMAGANGAGGFTHTHNAMSGYSHKSPGVLNAALSCRDIFCEIIPDGIHVPYPLVQSLFACKGEDYAVAVTDSLLAKGMGEGVPVSLGGLEVEAGRGAAYLKGTGTLAGSTLDFAGALRNLVEYANVPFTAALNACTINPARRVGIANRKGKLAAGYDADIVVLSDKYDVIQTYCRGGKCL